MLQTDSPMMKNFKTTLKKLLYPEQEESADVPSIANAHA